MKLNLIKTTSACIVVACLVAQPALAAVTDISSQPLGSAAGASYLPNLLFTLDNSGSMGWTFLPDYVSPGTTGNNTNSFPCMRDSAGVTDCDVLGGDPPFTAGGQFAMNGVGYDPNFTYVVGLDSNGQPHKNPPSGTLTPGSTPSDAYLGNTNVDLTNTNGYVNDRKFCNPSISGYTSKQLCKRNGASDTGVGPVLPAGGTDVSTPTAHTLGAGQFPYRTHSSNSSVMTFGLPEMMPAGIFVRNTTGVFVGPPTSTVRVTTTEPHGLATGDLVYTVVPGQTTMSLTCVAVAKVDNNNFTYATGNTGAVNTTAYYRKCVVLSGTSAFQRTSGSTTVTVNSPAHGLVVNDIITTSGLSTSDMNVDTTQPFVTQVVDSDHFKYTSTGNTAKSLAGNWIRSGLYNVATTINGSAISYYITPVEYCTDAFLTNCTEYIPGVQTPPTGAFPAYVRFCKTQADALAPGAVTGTSGSPATARCVAKFIDVTGIQYRYPRYGWFTRDTITSSVSSYGNRPNRIDCAGAPTCTYTEEIQNYAKWFAYYRTRLAMMKTSAGRAFLPFVSSPSSTPPKPDRLRVGFITIHAQDSGSVAAAQYLRIDTFNTANAVTWYTKFYAQTAGSGTPLREALSRAGWLFAGKIDQSTGSLTKGIPAADDPMQASCQKNYTFLTTDGFWNGNAGQTLTGAAIGNRDNVDNQLVGSYTAPDYMVSRNPSGTFDGNVTGASDTLADVAMYYYETDLRGPGGGPATSPNGPTPGLDVSVNNVQNKSGATDFATHQHMNTYTIGLADGLMRYQANYDDPAVASDFNSIRNNLTAAGNCFWTTGNCNWPLPAADSQSAIDDLWHAAVNGRGRFYSALNPTGLANGLAGALNNLNVTTASASAAATSSPQVSQQGTKAFSTLYQTSTWSGEVYAQNIDPQTGVVITTGANNGKVWEAQKLLVTKANAGTRRLLTYDIGDKLASDPPAVTPIPPVASRLKDFRWTATSNGALYPFEKNAYFNNKCVGSPTLSQCSTLTPLNVLTANDGSQLVDFLSGKATNEGTVFRDRSEIDASGNPVQTVLGDIVNSQPLFVRAPFFDYFGLLPGGTGQSLGKQGVFGTTSYADFQSTPRATALLIGANDGFLHAFNPDTGDEMWAYTPHFVMPNLWLLADTGYPGAHRFYVDGTPELADVFDTVAGKWKTIVVGGANSGARGFYALDITDPANPKGLWEFCSDSTLCPNDYNSSLIRSDPDLGFSYGNPVIGQRADKRWVVILTAGLNNVSAGTGSGQGWFFVLDAITGEILHKVGTGQGSSTTPSGLMKQGAYYPTGIEDPLFMYVYAGDQQGKVWRLDLTSAAGPMPAYNGGTGATSGAPWVKLLATLKDGSTPARAQPLTAKPAGTHLGNDPYNPASTRIYYVGTGRYLGASDLSDPGAGGPAWQQTIYGIRDQIDNPHAGWDPTQNFRSGGASFVVQQVLSAPAPNANRIITKNNVDWTKQDGFYVDLNPVVTGGDPGGDSPGERVVLDVKLILGTVIVTSTIPKSGCEPGGDSFQYFLDFKTGGYVGNDSTAAAGVHIGSFLVGTSVEQTADDMVKTLNKTVSGENRTASIPTFGPFQEQRFYFRKR